jgi:hypothetical protein
MIISALLITVLIVLLTYGLKLLMGGSTLGFLVFISSVCSIYLVFFPQESNTLANFFDIGRGADLLLYICFILGVLLVLLIHIKFRRQDILLTELVRKIALENVSKK